MLACFTSLPVDILREIFMLLPNDIYNIASTCKRFKEVINGISKRLIMLRARSCILSMTAGYDDHYDYYFRVTILNNKETFVRRIYSDIFFWTFSGDNSNNILRCFYNDGSTITFNSCYRDLKHLMEDIVYE